MLETQDVPCIFSFLAASVHQSIKSYESGGYVFPRIEGLILGHSLQRKNRAAGPLRRHYLGPGPSLLRGEGSHQQVQTSQEGEMREPF